MNLDFQRDQSEEYYRKFLLLNKLKPSLSTSQRQYIFNQKYCWDILFNDEYIIQFCFGYACTVLKGPFPEGEPYIAKSSYLSFRYAMDLLEKPFSLGEKIIVTNPIYAAPYAVEIIRDRWPEAEEKIFESVVYKTYYLKSLEKIGKRHELRI